MKESKEGMFRRVVTLLAIITAILGPNMVVGDAAEPLLKLALPRADMPATIEKKSAFASIDPEVRDPLTLRPYGAREEVRYRYIWPAGGTIKNPVLGSIDKSWVIAGNVFRAADENGAKRLFALGKAARIGHFTYEEFPGEPKSLNLPAYGDEQIALVTTHPSTGPGIMVFVRTRTIVWQMRVAALPLPFQPTQAEMRAVLEMYAAKQKARVAAG